MYFFFIVIIVYFKEYFIVGFLEIVPQNLFGKKGLAEGKCHSYSKCYILVAEWYIFFFIISMGKASCIN